MAVKPSSPAVVRAVHILDLLAQATDGITLADLARQTDYPKSSLHGLCELLVQLRLIKRLPDGAMSIGPHVLDWSNAFLTKANVSQEFKAAWEEANVFPNETVTLSVLDGQDVIYLACHNGNQPLGVTFRNGMRLPAPFTATGKAMLSTLPPAKVDALFAAGWPQPLTRASVPDLTQLHAELALCRENGYSVDDGQMRSGMICFGAPVFDSSGSGAIAGVAVSFVVTEIGETAALRIGAGISALAKRLSARMGAPASPAQG